MKHQTSLTQPERLKKAIHTLSALQLTDKELENALRALILKRREQLPERLMIPVQTIHIVREENTLRWAHSGKTIPVTPEGEIDWEQLLSQGPLVL